jgi:DNA replication and repair protein RecF
VLYRIVTLTADDIELVSGSPSLRRDFLNYALMLSKPEILLNFKRYKTILDQRNNLLLKHGVVTDELLVWTEKLWFETVTIQQERRTFLEAVQTLVNTFLCDFFSAEEDQLQITLKYAPRKKDSATTFQDFWAWYSEHGLNQELEWRRTQFGAHLDDFVITFENKKARIFASRGQQKLIVFLIKTAELQLTTQSGEPGIFLLDDFLTDFDTSRMAMCLKTLQNLRFQVVITTPTDPQFMIYALDQNKTCLIEL